METLNKATMEEMLSTPNRLLVGAGPGNLDPRVARALTLPCSATWIPASGRSWTPRQTCSARFLRPRMRLLFFFRQREWPGWRPCSLIS